jgi:hypothetical protein
MAFGFRRPYAPLQLVRREAPEPNLTANAVLWFESGL